MPTSSERFSLCFALFPKGKFPEVGRYIYIYIYFNILITTYSAQWLSTNHTNICLWRYRRVAVSSQSWQGCYCINIILPICQVKVVPYSFSLHFFDCLSFRLKFFPSLSLLVTFLSFSFFFFDCSIIETYFTYHTIYPFNNTIQWFLIQSQSCAAIINI